MSHIDVLMTCHNRRDKTLACLSSVALQSAASQTHVVLVDAGSSDGTADAVATAFPESAVVRVGDDVFWGGGMRLAGQHAHRDADHHLWLNDDVVLDEGALDRLLDLGRPDRIVVGKLRDEAGRPSYGGLVARPHRPLSLLPAPESDRPLPVDTMNGNVVLVGREVRERVGDVRGDLFPHAFGDIDYGYTARRHGCEVVQAPGFVGTCSRNPPPASRRLPTLRGRWSALVGTKELPPGMWRRACLRHGGVLAPAYFVWPYVRVLRRPAATPSAAS